MGSTRLPGKVLKPLAGQPMIARVVERTRRAKGVREVVVATTREARDEPLVDLCQSRGWPFTRGDEADLLDRYHAAAIVHRADAVVRITSSADRKSTRLNSSHSQISYAVFCLKKKKGTG